MSTLSVINLQSQSTTSPVVFQTSTGTEVGQLCRAWVNFNGTTSPGTIRASFNVSSVTKNGAGDYTVNFTNALADANYCVAAAGGAAAGGSPVPLVTYNQTAPSTTSVRLLSWYMTATINQSASDTIFANVAIFR